MPETIGNIYCAYIVLWLSEAKYIPCMAYISIHYYSKDGGGTHYMEVLFSRNAALVICSLEAGVYSGGFPSQYMVWNSPIQKLAIWGYVAPQVLWPTKTDFQQQTSLYFFYFCSLW